MREQDYFADDVSFVIALVPFVLLAALLLASRMQERLKVRSAESRVRARRDQRRPSIVTDDFPE